MRAVVITRHGPPEVLQVQARGSAAGSGEVLVDVRAAGINFADLMARLGLYPDAPKPPCVVGYEVAGTVAALGDGVEREIEVGQRVFALVRFGGYAERAAVRADAIFPLPEAFLLRRGRGDPDRLRDGVGGPRPRRQPPARRARADPGGRRRGRDRRHPDRQAGRRGDLGNVPRRASTRRSAGLAWITRSTTPDRAGSEACRSSIW